MEALSQGEYKQDMRNYVTADDTSKYDNQAEGCVRLDITHSNLVQRWHAIMFFRDMTILEVKEKLYRHGGTGAACQELYLRRGYDTIFLMDMNKTLRDYGVDNDMEIHIKDTDPTSLSRAGGLEDVSQVEKYVMKDEDYERRENTVRRLKKLEAQAKWKADKAREGRPETPRNVRELFPIGARCEVSPGARRGEVAYVGTVESLMGTWIGIRLDEPLGNNDGKGFSGHVYFECRPKYGSFSRAENVTVGDFPELDPFAFLEEGDEI